MINRADWLNILTNNSKKKRGLKSLSLTSLRGTKQTVGYWQ